MLQQHRLNLQIFSSPQSQLRIKPSTDDIVMPTPNIGGSLNRIIIGETQTFDDDVFGNIEVTLDYIEFIDRVENLFGGFIFADEGSVYLRAVLTLRNVGTVSGTLPTAWSRIFYDNTFEFSGAIINGITDINPLAPPITGSVAIMIPNRVAESDESLVIEFGTGIMGQTAASFVIRAGISVQEADTAPTDVQEWTAMHDALVGEWLVEFGSDLYWWEGRYFIFYPEGFGVLVGNRIHEFLWDIWEADGTLFGGYGAGVAGYYLGIYFWEDEFEHWFEIDEIPEDVLELFQAAGPPLVLIRQ